jgi:hypothetical protein
MKITLHTPDGTAETFTDCVLATPELVMNSLFKGLIFTGTDWNSKRRCLQSTLPYTIDISDTYATKHEVTEIFETSPLVQDNIPIQ